MLTVPPAGLVAPRPVPMAPVAPREGCTCGRAVLVPHHAHVLPQSLCQCHRHGRHVAVLREGRGVTAGTPGLSPARPRGSPRTHLVDAAGAGGGTNAPDKGGAAAAALKRPTPARKRMVGTGDAVPGPGGDMWPQRSREEMDGVAVLRQPLAPVLHKLVQDLQGVLPHPDPVLGRPRLHGHQHDAGVELLLVDLWGQRDSAGDATPPRDKPLLLLLGINP